MKSRQNPFQPAPRGQKAHYYPSRLHSLSEKEKQTSLGPERLNQRSGPQNHQLLEKPNCHHGVTDEEPVFTEIWPSFDCHSSPTSTTTSEKVSPELEVQQEPVLAKYIERFRHGPPQSREERQHIDSDPREKQHPFWWMSDSSLPPSSTPTKATKTEIIQPLKDDLGPAISSPDGRSQRYRSLSPCRGSDTILSEGGFDDTEILNLQERAHRLLLHDECALSDRSIHVSSEGLGCSDFSSPVSVDESPRRPLVPSVIKSTSALGNSGVAQPTSFPKSIVAPSLVAPLRPEEDILFQWRLRRKIEQARECPQPLQQLHGPTFSWQAPSFCNPSDSRGAYKERTQRSEFPQKATQPQITAPQSTEAHPSYPPASGPTPFPALVVSGSSIPQLQAIAHVPALMHLLCDTSPCPTQLSHASKEQNILQNEPEPQRKVSHKMTQVPGNSMNTFPEEDVCEFISPSLPARPDPREDEGPCQQKRLERNNDKTRSNDSERKTEMAKKKQKKTRHTVEKEHADDPSSTSRGSSHHKVPRNGIPQAEQKHEKGRQEKGDVPPPSPIQHALGQVVSEVLFPTRDSSPAQRTPVLTNSPPCTASTNHTVPPCDAHKSVEVISQLLQEAEDSDEKEFEDDPLLQVLRKQRTWVKEQISEVDSMLTDLQNEQEGT